MATDGGPQERRAGICLVRAEAQGPDRILITVMTNDDVIKARWDRTVNVTDIGEALQAIARFLEERRPT